MDEGHGNAHLCSPSVKEEFKVNREGRKPWGEARRDRTNAGKKQADNQAGLECPAEELVEVLSLAPRKGFQTSAALEADFLL
jgi:hypothetical protein